MAEDSAKKVEQPNPVWASFCIQDKAKKLLGCRLVQRNFVKKGDQRALLIAAQMRHPVGQNPYLFLRLPVGLALQAGVAVGVFKEGAKTPVVTAKAGIETCDQQGCAAVVQVNAEFQSAMAAGQSLSVDFRSIAGEPIRVGLSLEGYSQASKEIKARIAKKN